MDSAELLSLSIEFIGPDKEVLDCKILMFF